MPRAQGADADVSRVRALAAYRDFLALWKNADPDIAILKQAKAEYAKLQKRSDPSGRGGPEFPRQQAEYNLVHGRLNLERLPACKR